MTQIVTIINFKGGVGKTTCAVETATALARHYGKRTLLVDLDPQASATFYVMEQIHWKQWRDSHGTVYHLFDQQHGHFPIRKAIVRDVLQEKSSVFGFDLLPSDPNLVDVDLRLADFVGHTILQRYFDDIRDEYDYIICDCPPNFNPVTKNSLWASDAYVVPTVPDFLSTYGIGLLRRSVNKLFAFAHNDSSFQGPVLGGIILTRIRTNVKLHAAYCDQVRYDYPGNVFKHTISDSILVATSADHRLPISAIPLPKGHEVDLHQQFKDIAGEFISRIQHTSSLRKQGTGIR
ncbi:MAG TPA: ParA family protein [Ktedonobacteraceae bacterium]|nr:ParA family protein [Ktedonobacteraceae bacterium]